MEIVEVIKPKENEPIIKLEFEIVEEKEILLNIEIVENLYRNSELIDIMLEEFEKSKITR